jgi:hypothetical protein
VVASEATLGLLRSYFRYSVGVNADGGCHRDETPVPEESAFDFEQYIGNLKSYTHIAPVFLVIYFVHFESLFS